MTKLPPAKCLAFFYLKSGAVIQIECDSVKVEYDALAAIVRWSMNGARDVSLVHVNPSEIAAIIVRDLGGHGEHEATAKGDAS
jgi:hypothetical protein